MKLVIPYRQRDNSIELKYAIRSMHKYFTPLSGVILVGDRPDWYQGDYVWCEDIKGKKEESMQKKIIVGAPVEKFLYSNDDYFALESFDENLPNYFDFTCGELAEVHPQRDYREMYNNCPFNWLNFDVHTPMIMDFVRFTQSVGAMDLQTPIKTTYGNYKPALKGEYLCDVKIRGEHTAKEIYGKIMNRPFFSTHDSAVNDDLTHVLQELYPDPSPYEKVF